MNYRTGYEFEIAQRHQSAIRAEVSRDKLAQAVAKTDKPHFLLSWRQALTRVHYRKQLPKPKAPLA
jgi:hypothetical protein